MRLVVKDAARKTLKRIQLKAARAIMGDMWRIAADPFARHPQAKALEGCRACTGCGTATGARYTALTASARRSFLRT